MFDNIQFIGTQRSGSNLLRLMLNQHPHISAHHPPHLLKTFMPLLDKYGDLSVFDNRVKLVYDMCNWVLHNPVSWEPVTFDVDLIAETSSGIIDIYSAIYQSKCKDDNAKIWCCKSTHNIEYLDALQNRLNSFYVYLYRDGRDVALSFKKAYVGPKHIYEIAEKWNREQLQSLKFLDQIDPSSFIKISYEALIQHPDVILKELCEKLKFPFHQKMLEYYSSDESILTSRAGEMWKNVSKPILSGNQQKFLVEMPTDELEMFETVARNSLTKLGYKLNTSSDLVFTDNEILKFRWKDKELRNLAAEKCDINDIQHRKPQVQLMNDILRRFNSRVEMQ